MVEEAVVVKHAAEVVKAEGEEDPEEVVMVAEAHHQEHQK
jgi:hypothetical protein